MKLNKIFKIIAVKLFCVAAVILLICMAGGFQNSHAASVKVIVDGKVKVFEGKTKLPSSLQSVEADLDNIDLKIVPAKKQKISLSYSIPCKNTKSPLEYYTKDGVLYLKESGLQRLSNKEWKKKFGKKWWKHWPQVTLYLPEKTGIKNINVTKGDFLIGKEVHFADMDIQMNEGDIIMSGLNVSGTARINMREGDLIADDITVSGSMQVTAKEGDIVANGLIVQGKLQINSDEGDIIVARIGKKYFDAMTITANALDGEIFATGDMKTGKVKQKGEGRYYNKNGIGAGRVDIVTKEGDILLR